jgi:hypothetical protein
MEKQITNIHDACEAFRAGFKWSGSTSGGITYAHNYKRDGDLYSKEASVGENFWELYRQISFMALGSEPFNLHTTCLDTVPDGKFDCVTAEDLITIAACIKRVSKF